MVISLFEGCYDTAHVQLTISVESAVNNNLNTPFQSFFWKEDCPAAPTPQAVDRGRWQSVYRTVYKVFYGVVIQALVGGSAVDEYRAPWGAPAPAVLPHKIRVFGHNSGRGQMADRIFVMQN